MSGSERIRSLPIEDWPDADRHAWLHACRPGERLKRGGRASHLQPVTRADLQRRYGYFLDHLLRRGALCLGGEPAGLVTPENVAAYIAELQERVGSVTLYSSIYKLRRMAELLAPSRDFLWLREIEQDLEAAKMAKSKYPRLVTTTALVEAGLTLLAEAELPPKRSDYVSVTRESRAARRRLRGEADRADLNRAVLARNGLMLALLGFCPIRLKNFAALSLGISLTKVGSTWYIVVEPDDAKNRRADERPIPGMLTPAIDRYVEHHRPVLARGQIDPSTGPLWLSSQAGAPMPYEGVEAAFRRVTRATLGVEIGAHMARTAAATTSAARATNLPGLASALLGHSHPAVTEQHYNRATAHGAAQAYAGVLGKIDPAIAPAEQ